MSTPFDINVPVGLNEDVVLNFEDGSQVVGTPQELIDAASAGDIIGLHVNPAVITPSGDGSTTDTPPADAPADEPTEEPAPEAPAPEAPEAPVDPVVADTEQLDQDVKTLESDEQPEATSAA